MSMERARLLCSACKSGHIYTVVSLIRELGCRPDSRYKDGKTPLHYASIGGSIEVLKYLITKEGCDPETQDEYEWTPLHYASFHGHIEVVRYLVCELKCDWEVTDAKRMTLLYYAIEHCHTSVGLFFVNLLSLHDAIQVLKQAIEEGHGYLVKFISETKPNILREYKVVLHDVINNCKSRCEEIIHYLICVQLVDPESRNEIDQTPLHLASKKGCIDIVQYLAVERGCNPNVTDEYLMTPLHYASMHGHLEIFKFLTIKCECKIEAKDVEGRTVLHYACKYGHFDIVQFIRDTNCETEHTDLQPVSCLYVNIAYHLSRTKDHYLMTPLHLACIHGHIKIIRYLINNYNTQKWTKDKHRRTPLHLACENGHLDAVQYLTTLQGSNNRVSFRFGDKDRLTPLHYACRHGFLEIVSDLTTFDVNAATSRDNQYRVPLHYAAMYGHINIVRHLIVKCCCDPNSADNHGQTPLHYASLNGHKDIVCYLICELNINPAVCDKDQNTPLSYACFNGHADIVRYLLQQQQPSHKSKRLKALFLSCEKGWLEVVKVFFDVHNWNQNDTNMYNQTLLYNACIWGCTPLHLASKYGHLDIVQYLVSEQHYHPDMTDVFGLTALHHICSCKPEVSDETACKILTFLINQTRCNPNAVTIHGKTPLHFACSRGKVRIIKILLDEEKCDPNLRDDSKKTPFRSLPESRSSDFIFIRLFAYHGAWDAYGPAIVDLDESEALMLTEFIIKQPEWDPSLRDSEGETLLHYACKANRIRIAKLLLEKGHCNPNIGKVAPIYVTSNHEIIGSLIEYGTNLFDVYSALVFSKPEETSLQIIKYLSHFSKAWDPNKKASNGEVALHFACKVNHLKLAHYLLQGAICTNDPEILSPIFFLSDTMSLELVKGLTQHHPHLDPNTIYSKGCTMLHLACMANQRETVHYLLTEMNCNPNVLNIDGESPLQMCTNPEMIEELIQQGANPANAYKSYGEILGINEPLKPTVKVFIVGDPSAGKSTLTASLQKELSPIARKFTVSKRVTGVDEKTAGIVPHEFHSRKYGKVTLYDFAGQREFHSSHAALLQNAIQCSPPIFILVINLNSLDTEIHRTIIYWLTFLRNPCTFVRSKPHIIIVGSHADLLRSRGESNLKKKCKTVDSIFASQIDFDIEYVGIIAMDCQLIESNNMLELRRQLKKSCDAVRIQETISFNAHCFQVFLLSSYQGSVAVKIKDIIAKIAEIKQNSEVVHFISYIPSNIHSLVNVCNELNDRGHIIFLVVPDNAEKSWIILDKVALLADVTGTIFAPEGFKQHCELASSTGVVPLCNLKEQFPDHNPDMLIGFLSHLEFCYEVMDKEILRLIEEHHNEYSSDERYFYFPALVRLEVPDNVWEIRPQFSYTCGWTMQCTQPSDFFIPRFLQVLFLRLAFYFALLPSKEETDTCIPAIQRKCSVWKSGIFWGNRYGVEALVEVLSNNKSVIFLIRGQDTCLFETIELRSCILWRIRECVTDLCEATQITEGFINPSEVVEYPVRPSIVLHTTEIAKTVLSFSLSGYPSIVSANGRVYPIEDVLKFEPYLELGVTTMQELHHEEISKLNSRVSNEFIVTLCSQIKKKELFMKMFDKSTKHNTPSQMLRSWRKQCGGTYKQLRERLNQFSIFRGKNPFVSCCDK